MRFAPLQGSFAAGVLARHSELRAADSLILVEDDGSGERVAVRSDAALAILRYLGGAWKLALGLRIVPRALRDWCYDRFARMRHRLFGRYDTCPVPSAEVRARFIE